MGDRVRGETSLQRAPRVGIIGTGFGVTHHLPAWAAAGAEVVALCSNRPGRGQLVAAEHAVAEGYDDWRVMLDRADLDVVVVATRPDQHRDPVLAALDRGLHVVCEKPLSASLDDAEAMAEAAEHASTVSAVDFEFRLSDARLALKRAVESGWIGEVRSLQWAVRHPSFERLAGLPHTWLWELEAGGLVRALGSHYIDTVRWVAGPFTGHISGHSWSTVPDHSGVPSGADDSFTFSMGLEHGGASVSFAPTHGFFESTAIVVGSAGTLRLDDRTQTLALHGAGDAGETVLFDGSSEPAATSLVPRVTRFAELFLGAVRGARSPDLATFRDGAEVQRVLDRAVFDSAAFPVR